MPDTAPSSPAPRISPQTAARMVSDGDFGPARALFDATGSRLTSLTNHQFDGFDRALLTRNRENYGLYFVHNRARVPFLWLGLAWSADDPPGTLPSWGASLEVDGAEVIPFLENTGGLFSACQSVDARQEGGVRLHRFERHLELASWRGFHWLLDEADQGEAVVAFWDGYLNALAAGGLPAAVAAFIEAMD